MKILIEINCESIKNLPNVLNELDKLPFNAVIVRVETEE